MLRSLGRKHKDFADNANERPAPKLDRPKREPPGQRYRDYNHPTEGQHRTAEQFNWRHTKILNIGIAVAAIVAAVYARGSYVQVTRQANIAQDALIASDRAWLMLTDVNPVALGTDDEAGTTLTVQITVRNVGHSPAQEVIIDGKLIMTEFDRPTAVEMVDICRNQERSVGSDGEIVFPDQIKIMQPLMEVISPTKSRPYEASALGPLTIRG